MDIRDYLSKEGELPLDKIVENGGFCGIFRKIACVGDSLSSGEFESSMDGVVHYHDYYDYSWGQFLARDAGCTVYNFSKGGMTAKRYCDGLPEISGYCVGFADEKGYWDMEYLAQAYIIALGVNDITSIMNGELTMGTVNDIDIKDYRNNKPTFAGYYAQIIQRYKELQPRAKFFLMTIPKEEEEEMKCGLRDRHAELLYEMADIFDNCYVLDFRKYAPKYDKEFIDNFFLGHMSPAGYRLTALMVESYIDYIIRHNVSEFKQVGFIGTKYYYE